MLLSEDLYDLIDNSLSLSNKSTGSGFMLAESLSDLIGSDGYGNDYDIYNEGFGLINWNVFNNFMGNPEATDELLEELKRANSEFRSMSDKQLYKEKDSVLKFIAMVMRCLLDVEAMLDVVFAPFTLGITLIWYLLTRLLRIPFDAMYHASVVSEAKNTVRQLEELKRKNPKEAKQINDAIAKIEN